MSLTTEDLPNIERTGIIQNALDRPSVDAMASHVLLMKIQIAEGLLEDQFNKLQDRLTVIEDLRDQLKILRAADKEWFNDATIRDASTDDGYRVHEVDGSTTADVQEIQRRKNEFIAAIKKCDDLGITLPVWTDGATTEERKDVLLKNLDTTIDHLNTQNQQELLKLQKLQNERHNAWDVISGIFSRLGRALEKLAQAIKQ